jgi:hypothetical protein
MQTQNDTKCIYPLKHYPYAVRDTRPPCHFMTHWQALRAVPGNAKRGPAGTAGTGKRGRVNANPLHLYYMQVICNTHNRAIAFPRYAPAAAVSPVPVSRLFVRFSNRLEIYCIDCASKSLRVQAGGRGCVRASAFFCIIITPPTTFFAISSPPLPQRTLRIAVSPRDPRIAVCVAR